MKWAPVDYSFEGLPVEEVLKVIVDLVDPKERREKEKERQLNEVEMAMKQLNRIVREQHEILERIVKEISKTRKADVL